MDAPIADPYEHCEVACNHDLSRGITVSELVGIEDGPFPAGNLLVNLSRRSNTLFDEERREIVGRPALPTT